MRCSKVGVSARLRNVLVGVLVLLFVRPAGAEGQTSLPDIVEALAPSVVAIRVVRAQPQGSDAQPSEKPFVISEDGHIMTAAELLMDPSVITVTFDDRRQFAASVIAVEKMGGIAIIQAPDAKGVQPVVFSANEQHRRGETVLVIANMVGFPGILSRGVVAGVGLEYGAPLTSYMLIDAVTGAGSAGAPVFSDTREVIGMITSIVAPSRGGSGRGLALPGSFVGRVAEQLLHSGQVARGWLGVAIQNIDAETARKLGRAAGQGVLVKSVAAGSPTIAAGLADGDVILLVNGERVRSAWHLANRISDLTPETEVTLDVARQGQSLQIRVKLGRQPG